MAKKTASSDKTVTRIKASEPSAKKPTAKKAVTNAKVQPTADETKKKNVFGRFLGYFSGAWYELRQVHWPDRKSTWGLTTAVLLFSGFFVVFILIADAFFKYVFELILR